MAIIEPEVIFEARRREAQDVVDAVAAKRRNHRPSEAKLPGGVFLRNGVYQNCDGEVWDAESLRSVGIEPTHPANGYVEPSEEIDEDAEDRAAVEAALAEGGESIPLEQVKAEIARPRRDEMVPVVTKNPVGGRRTRAPGR